MSTTDDEATTTAKAAPKAVFTEGSVLRHISVMTATATTGLMALFMVDLIDLYFLSLLGEAELAAAVGYAGSILFFTTSVWRSPWQRWWRARSGLARGLARDAMLLM